MADDMEMEPPTADDGDGTDSEESDDSAAYAQAGQTIRHALADKDDEALARAVCDLVDLHQSKGDEPESDEDDGESMGKPKKPNLALIIASGRKGK